MQLSAFSASIITKKCIQDHGETVYQYRLWSFFLCYIYRCWCAARFLSRRKCAVPQKRLKYTVLDIYKKDSIDGDTLLMRSVIGKDWKEFLYPKSQFCYPIIDPNPVMRPGEILSIWKVLVCLWRNNCWAMGINGIMGKTAPA